MRIVSVLALTLVGLTVASCKPKSRGSATFGVSANALSDLAVGFVPVQNSVELNVSNLVAGNPGKQYAADLINSKLFAYVQCVSTATMKANAWMILVESSALSGSVFIDAERTLFLKTNGQKQPLPCTVFPGRLLSYPVALALFRVAMDSGSTDRDTFDVMQFFYLAMKGYDVPGREASALMIAFSHMAQEHGGASAMTANEVMDMMKGFDQDYNPCSSLAPSSKFSGASRQWRDQNFGCFTFRGNQSAKGYSPKMSEEAFESLRTKILVRIAAYHQQIVDSTVVDPAELKTLWNILTTGSSWRTLANGSREAGIAALLRGQGSADQFDAFSASTYGPQIGSSLSLTGAHGSTGFGLLQTRPQSAARPPGGTATGSGGRPPANGLPAQPGTSGRLPNPGGSIRPIAVNANGRPTTPLPQNLQAKITSDLAVSSNSAALGAMSLSNLAVLRAEAQLSNDGIALARIAAAAQDRPLPTVQLMGSGGVAGNEYLAFQTRTSPTGPADRFSYRAGLNQDWAVTPAATSPFTATASGVTNGQAPSTPAAGGTNVSMAQPAGTVAYRWEQGTAVIGNVGNTNTSTVAAASASGGGSRVPQEATGRVVGGNFEFVSTQTNEVVKAGVAFPTGFTNAAPGQVAGNAQLSAPATAVLDIESSNGTWSVLQNDTNRGRVTGAATSALSQLSADQQALCNLVNDRQRLLAATSDGGNLSAAERDRVNGEIAAARAQLQSIVQQAEAVPLIARESGVGLTPAQISDLNRRASDIVAAARPCAGNSLRLTDDCGPTSSDTETSAIDSSSNSSSSTQSPNDNDSESDSPAPAFEPPPETAPNGGADPAAEVPSEGEEEY